MYLSKFRIDTLIWFEINFFPTYTIETIIHLHNMEKTSSNQFNLVIRPLLDNKHMLIGTILDILTS